MVLHYGSSCWKALCQQCIHEINSCEVSSSSGNMFPLGSIRRTTAAPTPNLWPLNVFFPWYTSKSSIRPFGEARTKTLRPVGFGLPGTYCLTGPQPVKGMICSSIQSFSDFGRLRQLCLTGSRKGLTYITCHLADAFIQSNLQLTRLSRRHTPWSNVGVKGLAQGPNSCADLIVATPGIEPLILRVQVK